MSPRFSMLASAIVTTGILLGCSSSPKQDSGLAGPTSGGVTASDKNPYGVPYPATNVGHDARHGSIAGSVMPNFKLLGYKNAEQTAETPKGEFTGVSLADFYDPDGKLGIKVIHIQVASVWCGPC